MMSTVISGSPSDRGPKDADQRNKEFDAVGRRARPHSRLAPPSAC
jgi:hypothetical protein